MKLPHIDKGDYLIFASIGQALGFSYNIEQCQIDFGVWRRHWNLQDYESRSDISRDGYIGVIFLALVSDNLLLIHYIISAGWKRLWQMGDRGKKQYTNIWPLIPYLYAAKYGPHIPTPPALVFWKGKYGYRAHLNAMFIMIDFLIGKPYSKHEAAINKLFEHNPDNPLFAALARTEVTGGTGYDWGGCPPEIHAKLTEFAKELVGGK